MPDFFKNNLQLLRARFPHVADFAISIGDKTVGVMQARDGASFFAVKEADGRWRPISNPHNPLEYAQKSLDLMMRRIVSGLSPALVVGLAPGYALDTIFGHFKSRLKHSEPFRRIYVIVDSAECLACWLSSADRSHMLCRDEVEFYLAAEIHKIVELCENDLARSHLFVPVSELPEPVVSRIIQPLADLYLKREKEAEAWRKENDEYYDALTDAELAKIIQGKAGRKPRLLMPTHTSSTVVQYSTRDTCEAFEKLGWETRILKIEHDLPPWRLIKAIHEFKPDLFIFINHLRTEDDSVQLYPQNMLFATWIQDAMPAINKRSSAELWNNATRDRNRDLLVGYAEMPFKYGYNPFRLKSVEMIVNAKLFCSERLSPAERERLSCDVCFASNRGLPTDVLAKELLLPSLEKQGFDLACLMEVHDMLWEEYRSGRTFTHPKHLRQLLTEKRTSFGEKLHALGEEAQEQAATILFWSLNDAIYRYVVLEWLDDMGVRIRLYGREWAKHPKFKKYDCGPLKHGVELSKAYRAARFCLHLNVNEENHQRLAEILASGALPVVRLRESQRIPTDLCESLTSLFDAAIDGSIQSPLEWERAAKFMRYDLHTRSCLETSPEGRMERLANTTWNMFLLGLNAPFDTKAELERILSGENQAIESLREFLSRRGVRIGSISERRVVDAILLAVNEILSPEEAALQKSSLSALLERAMSEHWRDLRKLASDACANVPATKRLIMDAS